jgi:hypothetical protein
MTAHGHPKVFHTDLTGANGTPFRFVLWPEENRVLYYDRRYTYVPGQPGYGLDTINENGRVCGPWITPADLSAARNTGLCGRGGEGAWDVDPRTVRLVSAWAEHVLESYGAVLETLWGQ